MGQHEDMSMTNAIGDGGNGMAFDMGASMPFDLGGGPGALQGGMQADANVGATQMFAPPDDGGVGDMGGVGQVARHAPAQQAGVAEDNGAAQGAGGKSGGGADMAQGIGQIMDIIKQAHSAATQLISPILGMITSMMGKAGGAGGGGA